MLVLLKAAIDIALHDIRRTSVIFRGQWGQGAPAISYVAHEPDKEIRVWEIGFLLGFGFGFFNVNLGFGF
ncbi:hypothetical protein ACFX14_006895 [Malus domestica]